MEPRDFRSAARLRNTGVRPERGVGREREPGMGSPEVVRLVHEPAVDPAAQLVGADAESVAMKRRPRRRPLGRIDRLRAVGWEPNAPGRGNDWPPNSTWPEPVASKANSNVPASG